MALPVKIVMEASADRANGTVRTYDTGTSNLGTYIYSDNALTAAIAQGASLDSNGRLEAYCSETAVFRLQIRASDDITVLIDVDPAELGSGVGLDSIIADTTTDNFFSTGAGVAADEMWQKLLKSLNNLETAATGQDVQFMINSAFSAVDDTNDTGAVGRAYQFMLSDVFNVKCFGATGDGTTDDRTAIVAAITALGVRGRGVLYFPATDANYRCNSALTLNNLSNIAIIGDGPGSVIRQSGTGFNLLDFTGTGENVLISNLTLWGGGTNASTDAYGIDFTSGNTNNIIKGVFFSGTAQGTGFNRAINCSGAKTTIDSCHFERLQHTSSGFGVVCNAADISINNSAFYCNDGGGKCDNGINATSNAAGLRITGCHVEDGTGASIEIASLTTGAVISGCDIQTSGAEGILLTSCDEIVIQGCRIKGSTTTGVTLTDSDYCVVQGCTIMSNGTDGILVQNLTSSPSTYCTISANTIALNGNDGVNITSDDASGIPLGITVSANSISANAKNGVTAHGQDCAISANAIAGNGTDSSGTYYGVEVGSGTGTDRNLCIAANSINENSGTALAACVKTQGASAAEASVLANFLGSEPVWDAGSTQSPFNHANTTVNGTTFVGDVKPWRIVSALPATLTTALSSYTIIVTAGAGTLTLPAVTGTTSSHTSNISYRIINAGAGTCTLAGTGGDTVYGSDGSSGAAILTKQTIDIQSYGDEWFTNGDGIT